MKYGSLKSWKSTPALSRLARRFLEVFGACWLFIEPMALWRPDDLRWGLRGYLALAGASLIVSIIWAWPKNVVTRKLSASDTEITIRIGDLLSQNGNVIIGVSDAFDTEIGDVISPTSIQGQFQSRIFPNQGALDGAIDLALSGVGFEVDNSKLKGKQKRYPIGTIATLTEKGSRYFLIAYTRMRNDLRVESDICKLSNALKDCWESIRTHGQRDPVHMGIVGSGHARIGLSRMLLLQFIVLSFLDAERKENLTSHLTIYIHEKDADHIDFVDLENWLSGITRAA